MHNIRRGLVAAALAVVALVGCANHTSEPVRASVVSTYNDGFATSKQDDCDQGFKPACAWLAHNH
jgi:uncharacterized membrane protein